MASLSLTRCFNHGQREAVARCPSCRRHYCRECVTEHEHRLLCASCIEALTASSQTEDRKALPFIPMAQLLAAVFVLWVSFYTVGQALLLIPSEFHSFESSFLEEINETQPAAKPAVSPGSDAVSGPEATRQ